MASAWVMRPRNVALPTVYVGETYIVFLNEDEAIATADVVEKVSGERPVLIEATLWKATP